MALTQPLTTGIQSGSHHGVRSNSATSSRQAAVIHEVSRRLEAFDDQITEAMADAMDASSKMPANPAISRARRLVRKFVEDNLNLAMPSTFRFNLTFTWDGTIEVVLTVADKRQVTWISPEGDREHSAYPLAW